MDDQNVYSLIEDHLMRFLKPFERQTIDYMLKENSEEMVKEAVRVAALYAKDFSLPYIEKILANWRQRGFTTVEQVREAEAERQKSLSGETSNVPKWATEEVEELPPDPERTKKFIDILVSMHAKAKYGTLTPTEAELEDCRRDIEKFRKGQMNAQRA